MLTFWIISAVKEKLFCFDKLGQFGVSNIIVYDSKQVY